MLAADWGAKRLPLSAVNSKMAEEESQDSGVADMEPVPITGLEMEEADDDTPLDSGLEDLAQPPACNNEIGAPSEQEMHDSGFVDIDTLDKDPERHDEKDECMVLKSNDSHDKINPLVHDRSIAKTIPTQPVDEPAFLASNVPSLSISTNSASNESALLPTASITIQKELSARVTREPLSHAKKPRGRPRKAVIPNDSTTNSSKPRGRPHEDPGGVASTLTKRKRNTTILPSTAPASLDQDGWLNIDEISDSDTPPTPSPPRRHASHSPVALQPLEFDAPVPPTESEPAITSKAGEKPDWATTSAALFPRITHTIRSAPAASTPSKPSWHTKILLYDPLPLEDFTAWLNAHGVRYTGTETETVLVERKDGKGARKKREMKCVKKELEVEVWMVQKWCEEMGVCCFSRESGRGGAKARY
ncbi:5'-flap endonuclease [Cryomyces antarcticus]|nr:5'-flap endonuclease [Cryomyces antarcticus]